MPSSTSFSDLPTTSAKSSKANQSPPQNRQSITKAAESIQRAANLLKDKLPDPDATTSAVDADTILSTIREEFGKLREDIKSERSPPTVSYAAAAAKKPTKAPTPKSRPAIIVSASDSNKSRAEVATAWRKEVSFKDTSFAPSRVTSVSNNKLRVEFDSIAERDEALRRTSTAANIRAEAAHRRKPLVAIKGISKDIESEHLVEVIRCQNPTLHSEWAEDSIKLRFIRSNRNEKLYNAVFEVSPLLRRAMLEIERVNIDHQRVRVSDHSPLLQCFACLQFGHTRAKCTSECKPCSHCASKEHEFRQCPSKDTESLRCFNCTTDNAKFKRNVDTCHSATSNSCPKVKSMVRLMQQRIDYGI